METVTVKITAKLQPCPENHAATFNVRQIGADTWGAWIYCDRRDCHWVSAMYIADSESAALKKAAVRWNAVMGAYHARAGSGTDLRWAERAAEALNRALCADPQAIMSLVNHRVACNQRLADDATIQVGSLDDAPPWRVGLLGVINGIVGCDANGLGLVMALGDVDDSQCFTRIERFVTRAAWLKESRAIQEKGGE